MKNIFLGSKGFTLIELVIVFSVITILSLFGLASFVNYSRVQAITNDANNIVNLINTAKANAVSQVKPSSCSGADVLHGYIVEFNKPIKGVSNKGYTINVLCSKVQTTYLATNSLSSSVIFDTSASDALKSISFFVLTGGIKLIDKNDNQLTGDAQLKGTITIKGYGLTRIITFDRHGNISISE